MRLPVSECGWREVGIRLADAMKGSDMEVYYSLLCHVEMRIQADKERIKPTKALSNPDSGKSLENATEVVLVEKVADMTHKGSGL